MNPAPDSDNEPHWIHNWLTAGKRTWRYEKRFALSMLGWAVCLAACMYVLKHDLVSARYAWLLALLPLALAVIPIRAYYQFFSHADELVRKIQIESIVISFCTGLLYAVTWTLLEAADLEPATAGDSMVVMLFALGFGQLYCAWKYR